MIKNLMYCDEKNIYEDEKPDLFNVADSEDENSPNKILASKVSELPNKITFLRWHDSINNKLRLIIKSDLRQDEFKELFVSYLKCLKENLPYLLPYPKRCRHVAKKITRILLLFKNLYNNTTEIDLYNAKICEFLSIITTLELKYASNFDEPKTNIVNRVYLNYAIHLKNLDISHVLKVFLYLNRNLLFDQAEVLTKIFEKYLKNFKNKSQNKLNDKLFCMYLVAYDLWVHVENDVYEKNNIKTYANTAIAPRPSLRSNSRYAPFLPEYPFNEENITKFILDKGFNRIMLVKSLIADDSYEEVIINLCDDDETQQIIELDKESPEKEFAKLQLLSEIKYESPEVVAMIDLTEDKKEMTKRCVWIEKLIRLTRQAKKNGLSPYKRSTVELIDLDENEIDEEEENTGAIDQKNSDSNCDEVNENHKEKSRCNFEDIANFKDINHKDDNKNKSFESEALITESILIDQTKKTKEVPPQELIITNEEIEKSNKEKCSNDESIIEKKLEISKNVNVSLLDTTAKHLKESKRNFTNKSNIHQENIKNSQLEHIHSENSITSSETKNSGDSWSEFIPIFDEDLSFVTNYAAKTYSKNKNFENTEDITKECGNIEEKTVNKEYDLFLEANVENESNIENNQAISSTCTFKNCISGTLKSNSRKENKVKNNFKSQRVVHRFSAPKKVNFAPLPEKHIANPKDPSKKDVFEKRNNKEFETVQTSFLPPVGTEAFKLYETRKEVLQNKSFNNYSRTKNVDDSMKFNISSTFPETPCEKKILFEKCSEISVSNTKRTLSKAPLESRPTASSILLATGVKSRGNSEVSGMIKLLNTASSELNTHDDKNLNDIVISDTLKNKSTGTSFKLTNFNLDPDSTVGDDCLILGCESDSNLSSKNINFNITRNSSDDLNLSSIPKENSDECNLNQKLGGEIAIFSQNFKDNKQINFDDTEFSEDDDEETNLTNGDYVDKNLLPIIQEADYPDDMDELEQLLINTYDDSSYKDITDNLNHLCFNKKVEGQTSLPLKKRRKLSNFSDNLSIKDEDLHFLDFQKIKSSLEEVGEKVIEQHQPVLSSDGISYPSTPMLSIANFENVICLRHHVNQPQHHQHIIRNSTHPQQILQSNSLQYNGSTGTFKDINGNAVNLQTINILPTQHATIIENSNKKTNILRNYNLLPGQTQTVVSNNKNQTNIQTFNIIPANNFNKPCNNSSSITTNNNIQFNANAKNLDLNSAIDSNNFNLNVYKETIPSVQTLNVMPNSFQYTQTFHRNHNYSDFSPTHNFQQQIHHSKNLKHDYATLNFINTKNSQTTLFESKSDKTCKNLCLEDSMSDHSCLDVDMSNYNLNHQHLNNYLYNSQYNMLAKQNILNDINKKYEHSQSTQICNKQQEQKHLLKKHSGERFLDPNFSTSSSTCSSTSQQKKHLKPTGKPQAFLQLMNNACCPKITSFTSDKLHNCEKQTLSCECNIFKEQNVYLKKNKLLENTFFQNMSNETDKTTEGLKKKKGKAYVKERITRASHRIAKNKAHDAQKKKNT